LCGLLGLEIDGRDVASTLAGGQAGLLVCYLLASRERAADRDELVDLLWPRRAPKDPGAALRPLLSRLRRALAPATLEGRERLRLILPEPVWIDVEAAARAVEDARAAVQEARWSVARGRAEAAVELLRPGLLPAQDGEWLQAARWEHEELMLEALESVAQSGLALGRPGAAAAERASRELIARSKFRETGYRFLIEALAARGNVAEALRVYERLRVLLRDELGVAPAAELQALHLRLLSGEGAEPEPVSSSAVDARPADRNALPAPLSLTSPLPFVGRSSELETLRRLMRWDEEAGGRAVLIGGEAGSGKSRLVREFAGEAVGGGALVLHGGCDVMVHPPYGPFVEALDHLIRVIDAAELREGLGPTAGELVRLLPGLPAIIGEPAAPVDADPDTERHRLHTAVADLLRAIGHGRPLLLIIEDVQWADAPSLGLLRHLVRTSGSARVLLVATFRDTEAEMPEALSETLADLRRSEGVVRLALGRLSGAEVGHFVQRAAGLIGDAAELTDAIDDVTGGNPFLLCELWRTLVDSDVLDVADGAIRMRRPLTELGVPHSVREVAGQRVARLAPETRELLELAATAGAEFDLDALHRPGDPPPVAPLDEAVRSGLVEELPSGSLAYRFTHDLLRRALYDGLSRIRRAELHLRVGEALERSAQRSGRRLADLAHHFTMAAPVGGAARGVQYSVLAAGAAGAALAFEEAAERLQRALELGIDDAAERAEVLLELGNARHRAGRALDALAAFEEAARLARELGYVKLLARAAIGYEIACWRPGITDPVAVELLEEAADALRDERSQLRVRVLGGLARALEMRGDHRRGGAVRAEAVGTARSLGDPAALASVLVTAVWASGTSSPAQTLADLTEARDLAVQLRDRELEVEAMSWRLEAFLALCDIDAARREVRAVRAMAEQTAQPFQIHMAEHCDSAIALCQGRLAEAEQTASRSRDWSRLLSGRDASGVYGVQMFGVRREQGRLAELAPLVRVLAAGTAGAGAWRPGLASLLVELGMADEARSVLAQVAADGLDGFRESLWLASLTYLTDACTALGDETVAAMVYPELAPYARANLVIGHVVACYGAADRFLGMLAATLGDLERAERHFERAMELNRRMGARTWLAHTAYQYGRTLVARRDGDRARAAALLGEAETLAEQIGMPALRRRLEDLGASQLPDGLSFRDAHLLALLAAGMSNREIGAGLGVSEHTAAKTVRSLLRRTGCNSRGDAAALAGRLRLAAE